MKLTKLEWIKHLNINYGINDLYEYHYFLDNELNNIENYY